jgi:hypothetical protein
MKIEFDNHQDKELFLVLLSSFISMSVLEEDEQNFINRLHEAVTVNG